MSFENAITELRAILGRSAEDEDLRSIIPAKARVLDRYQPLFKLENLNALTADEFKSFLLFQNNQHWTGLHRGGPAMTADMSLLREGLSILLDESRPIKDRIDQLIPMYDSAYVPKLGKATATAVLHLAHPDKYAVYNGTSEGAMTELGVFPALDRGATVGDYYVSVNDVCQQIAQTLGIDLWTLDALWWRVGDRVQSEDVDPVGASPPSLRFGLERQLHNFMADNWSELQLGHDWDLYEQQGDIVGVEFNTKTVGRIDLLAKHKVEPAWLVIEIKKDQTSDETVGQVLRYMGWVADGLAEENEEVRGIIVAYSGDDRIKYALKHTQNVSLACYKIDFQLQMEQ